jgi:hypothetical protein
MFHHKWEEYNDPARMATVIATTDVLLGHIGAAVPCRPVRPMEEPLFYRLNMTPAQVTEVIAFAERLQQDESFQ